MSLKCSSAHVLTNLSFHISISFHSINTCCNYLRYASKDNAEINECKAGYSCDAKPLSSINNAAPINWSSVLLAKMEEGLFGVESGQRSAMACACHGCGIASDEWTPVRASKTIHT